MTIDKVKKPKQKSWVPAVLIGMAIAYLFLVQYIPAINVFFLKLITSFLQCVS